MRLAAAYSALSDPLAGFGRGKGGWEGRAEEERVDEGGEGKRRGGKGRENGKDRIPL